MKIFDFEPQFIVGQRNRTIILGQKTQEVGHSFWARGNFCVCWMIWISLDDIVFNDAHWDIVLLELHAWFHLHK